MRTQNNYRVPGTKMASRFGYSHRQQRAEARHLAKFYGQPTNGYHPPLRLLRTCQHPAKYWVDESWGGPESGGEAGHCRFCGWGFRHIMY